MQPEPKMERRTVLPPGGIVVGLPMIALDKPRRLIRGRHVRRRRSDPGQALTIMGPNRLRAAPAGDPAAEDPLRPYLVPRLDRYRGVAGADLADHLPTSDDYATLEIGAGE